jgi:hypothetical protein
MLIMAGGGNGTPLDYDELERWTRVGYERGTRSAVCSLAGKGAFGRQRQIRYNAVKIPGFR